MTLDEIERETTILDQIDRGAYPHGLDLRPLEKLMWERTIGVAMDHGRLRIYLLTKGRKRLESARRLLQPPT